MGTVNGNATPSTANGVTIGTGNGDHIAGTSGNDSLYGTGGNDLYYGGAGNDSFVISQSALAQSSSTTNGIAAQAVIYDFGGAGGWSSSNNDFVAFTGFGTIAQGSALQFDHYGYLADGKTVDQTQQFYSIHDGLNGQNYEIFIHSVDGHKLVLGDYNFY